MSKPAVAPESPELLADLLRDSAFRNKTIALAGNDSKLRMAGPAVDAEVVVSTRGLGRVLQYEPKDLTISVEAGMPFNKLQELLGAERQMIALDPLRGASHHRRRHCQQLQRPTQAGLRNST